MATSKFTVVAPPTTMYNPYQQLGYGAPQQPQQTGYGFNAAAGGQMPQQQYQTGFYQQQQPGYQPPGIQQNGFQPQATGFQPSGGFQTQPTSFQPQTGFQPQQTGFQQTGFQPALQQPGPQQTGMQAGQTQTGGELKIPNIRLSFITASDQSKFENLFRTALSKGESAISGDAARDILLRSGLQPVSLAEIWSLSDTNKSGSLLFPEFALSLHLCNLALKGEPLPAVLPERWSNEVQSFVDAISFSVPEDPATVMANTPFASMAEPKNSWMDAPAVQPGVQPGVQSTMQPQRTGGGTLIPLQPQQTAGLVPAQTTGFQSTLGRQNTGYQPAQQQSTGFQPSLQQQSTGFQPSLQQQSTGFQPSLQQQSTGFQPSLQQQSTGFQPSLQQQSTGFQAALARQNTGYQQLQGTGYQAPLQLQGTGFQQQQGTGFQQPLQQQNTGYQQPLQQQGTGYAMASQPTGLLQQPTGKPGQWGFVSMPTGGIPGLSAMEQHFMPNAQLSSNQLQNQMGGSLKTNVTWAITKQEKQIYDGIFREWDKLRQGYVDGETAIGIFGKSGLARPDLELIWNLADGDNKGKLNKDEFAVAMHLVYRRLNGFDLPLRLPPELVPPSKKHIQDSVDTLKNSLKGGQNKIKRTGTASSLYKHDDDSVGYVSRSRHRKNNGAPAHANMSVTQLKKEIREKKILLDALDSEDRDAAVVSGRDRDRYEREIELLKYRIEQAHAKAAATSEGSTAQERAQLLGRVRHMAQDKLPRLTSAIQATLEELAAKSIVAAKLRLQKEYPEWSPESEVIVGTGPNGAVTEYDRKKHQSKQLLKRRMAALSGAAPGSGSTAADDLLARAAEDARASEELQKKTIGDIGASIKELEDGCIGALETTTAEGGAERWETGKGVSDEVRRFVASLPRAPAREAPARTTTTTGSSGAGAPAGPGATTTPGPAAPAATPQHDEQTPENRAAYIKAQAEKRMNDRLARLGIRRRDDPKKEENNGEKPPVKPEPKAAKSEPEKAVNAPPTAPAAPAAATTATPAPAATPVPTQSLNDAPRQTPDDDLEDEEYAALMKQKKELEEKKLRKKKEKEERLARLKREMAAMEDDSDDEPVTSVPTYTNGAKKETKSSEKEETESTGKAVEEAVPSAADSGPQTASQLSAQPAAQPTAQPTGQSSNHASNPFAKNNPFFKPSSQTATIDPKKAAAQRDSQRGLGSDDWSDSEDNSSDDDGPNRAGAAKLASMLFGGMASREERPEQKPVENTAAKVEKSSAPSPASVPAAAASVPAVPASEPAPPVPESVPQPPAVQASIPPAPTASPPVAVPEVPELAKETESDDDWGTPLAEGDEDDFDFGNHAEPETASFAGVPPVPETAPPVPETAPPAPETAPPVPEMAPPVPETAPPAPAGIPPPPPPPMGGLGAPSLIPPPPPGLFPLESAPGIPPPPPPPSSAPAPPPPPPLGVVPGPPAGGAPNIGALLGQITGGKSLRKVDESQQKIADGATVGRVID